MLALLNPGDKILGFDLAHGGHLTHGSPVNYSGKIYRPFFYGVKKEDGYIDYDSLEKTATKEKPKLIICGASSYSRDWDYKKIREVADSVGALVLADIAHPSGLISRGLLNDPLDYCHVVTSTTHKTFRGPRGGIIMMRNDFENPFGIKTPKGILRKVSSLLDSGVFPGTQGGPLEHIIGAKAVAFKEALSDKYLDYVVQVKKNANTMSKEFVKRDYNIISGGTENHLMLIDLRNKNITGKEAEENLGKADITSHINFKLLKEFFKKNSLKTKKIVTQQEFLKSNGIIERAEILAKKMKFRDQSDLYLRLKRLLHPKLMGNLFKVALAYNCKNKNFNGFN